MTESTASNSLIAPDNGNWKKFANNVFKPQANVFFEVVNLTSSTSSYDSDLWGSKADGILANNPFGPDPEISILLRDVPPVSGMFNYYIVENYANIVYIDDGSMIYIERPAASTFQNFTIANSNQICSVASQEYVFAHELGHLLGMTSHAPLADGVNCLMLSGSQSNGGKEIKAKHWLLLNP